MTQSADPTSSTGGAIDRATDVRSAPCERSGADGQNAALTWENNLEASAGIEPAYRALQALA